MTEDSPDTEQNRNKAAELYAAARKLEVQGDYDAAIRHYEQSLQLYDDESVKEAFDRLLATIGPL